ncbi:MAG: hypothetical protein ABFS42_12305 [Candidatus Krumholzibacteriota bacterium]
MSAPEIAKKLRLAVIGSLIALFVALAVPALADQPTPQVWHHVSVTTADSTLYEDVSLAWGLSGYSINLTAADGTETTLSPSQVAAIRDSSGADITNAVADASPATDVDFALIGDRRAVPFEFKVLLAAGGTGGLISGDSSFSPTGAFFAGARVGLGSHIHLNCMYRRQRVVDTVHPHDTEISANANEFHLLVGYRTTPSLQNPNYSYLEMGLALVQFSEMFNAERNAWTGDGSSGLGVTLQGGLVIPLSSKVGLDLGGILMARPTLVEDISSPGLLIGINAALTLSF